MSDWNTLRSPENATRFCRGTIRSGFCLPIVCMMVLLIGTSLGNAAPTLTVSDGNTVQTVSNTSGSIQFNGSMGVWTLITITGQTKPVLGNATNARMDIGGVAMSSGAGSLYIALSETDFTNSSSVKMEMGGTLNQGTLSAGIYCNTSNVIGQLSSSGGQINFGSLVLTQTVKNVSPFGLTVTGGQLSGSPVAATEYIVVKTTGPGLSSASFDIAFYTILPTPFEAWQLKYFGCTNCPQAAARADPFGKGMNNSNQFLVGLNPTNPASLFRVVSSIQQSNGVNVAWQTVGGHTNVVQVANDVAGLYTNISSNVVITGSGDTVTNYLDTSVATNGLPRFYKIQLVR